MKRRVLAVGQGLVNMGTEVPDGDVPCCDQLLKHAGEEGRVQVQGLCWQAAIAEGLTPASASLWLPSSLVQRDVYVAWEVMRQRCVAALAAKGMTCEAFHGLNIMVVWGHMLLGLPRASATMAVNDSRQLCSWVAKMYTWCPVVVAVWRNA